MATTAIWDVTDRLDRVIDYAANPEKPKTPILPVPTFKACARCWIIPSRMSKPKNSSL